MSVYPRDVVYTEEGVIHVHSTKIKNEHGGESMSITVSGLNGDGEMLEDVPVSNLNKNLLRANASERDARELFNHERRLRNLEEAVFGCSDDLKALTRYRVNSGEPWVRLVLNDWVSANEMFRYLDRVGSSLLWAREWVEDGRVEWLESFDEFRQGCLAGEAVGFSECKSGCVSVTFDENGFRVSGCESGLEDVCCKATRSDGSVSLGDSLKGIFLDGFTAGSTGGDKPLCLPSRDELEGSYLWSDSYSECRGNLWRVTSDILFDIEKCERRLIWVRNEVGNCYMRIGAMINQVVFPRG
jgi:hypothetical protein